MPRRRGPDGKRSLLTTDRRAVLLEAIKSGNRLQVAARIAHVSPATAEEWMRRGRGLDERPAHPMYKQFVRDVEEAQAIAEMTVVAHMHNAMPRSFEASKFWLQSAAPEYWGRGAGDLPALPPGPAAPQISNNVLIVTQEQLAQLGLQQVRQLQPPTPTDVDDSLAELTVGRDDEPASV